MRRDETRRDVNSEFSRVGSLKKLASVFSVTASHIHVTDPHDMSLSGPTFVPKWPQASSANSEKYKYAKYHLMPWWEHYQGAIKTSSSTARHSKPKNKKQNKKQKTHINGHWPKHVFVALPNPQDTYRAKCIYAF